VIGGLCEETRSGQLGFELVRQKVRLPKLPAGSDTRQLTAAHHSGNSAAFPGLQDGPVKGMASWEARAVPE
jgi:hypothetical protein